jgi:hypothetical protein
MAETSPPADSFADPASRARPLRLLPVLLLTIALTWAAGEAGLAVVASLGGGLSVPWALVKDVIAVGLLGLALVFWQIWQARGAGAALSTRPAWGRLVPGVLTGFAIGAGPVALAWLLLAAAGAVEPPLSTISPGDLALALMALPLGLLLRLLHGLVEHLLVQRIAQAQALRLGGPVLSLVAGGACFAAIQALQGYVEPWQLVNGCLLGALLAAAALGSGGLLAAVVGHAAWTVVETGLISDILGLSVLAGGPGGAGPDSYGSPVFGLCLAVGLALLLLADRSVLRREEAQPLQQMDKQG